MKVQDILTDESKWCRCHNATDRYHRDVPAGSKKAKRFCLYGAVLRTTKRGPKREAVLKKIRDHVENSIIHWNDTRRSFKSVRDLIEDLDI